MTPARRSILTLGLNITAVGLLTGALALGAADLVGPQVGFYPMVVVSGSMAPALPVGSLVVVERSSLEALVPGDIVTVRLKSGDLLTHRLGRVVGTTDGPALVLKGDANDAADPLPVPATSLVGRVAFSAPGIGFAFWALRQPIGLVTFGALIAMLLMTARAFRPRVARPSPSAELGASADPGDLLAGSAPAETPSRRRFGRFGAAAPVLLASLALAVVFGSGSVVRSAAIFNDSQALSGNTFSSGTWLTWRGPWSSATTYYANEIVSYAGSSWIATVTTLAATPGVSPDWQLLAAKGDTGATGATGATGPTGPTGSTGATGPGYLATSTSSISMGIGSKTFTTQAGLAYLANDRVRVSTTSTIYMEGVVASYSGTTLTVTVDRVLGAVGPYTSWNIGLAGDVGPTGNNGTNGTNGTNGAGYTATSTTNIAIGTGAKAFDTQAGLAYVANVRVRVANSSSAYMEGVVASYTGTTLTVTVDHVVGSGTFTSWNIGVAGDVGAQGPAGTNGTNGATGATGATGPAGSGWTLWFSATGATSSGQCIAFLSDKHAACPATVADADYNFIAVAAGNLSHLTAMAGTAPAAGKSYVVNVLDNGTAVLSCTVAATTNSCANAGSVAVTAGHYIQVQVATANGAANSAWKVLVTFGS